MPFDKPKIVRRIDPESEIQFLPGVGPKRAELLARLGVTLVRDLLYLFPRRYLDLSAVTRIGSLGAAESAEVSLAGTVRLARPMYARKREIGFEAVLDDGSGWIVCRWFGRTFLKDKIEDGQRWLVYGSLRLWRGKPYLSPQEYFRLEDPEPGAPDEGRAGQVTPVYPLTEGLTQWQMRRLSLAALPSADSLPEHLPDALRRELGLMPRAAAVRSLHRPSTLAEVAPARRSLAFDELFYLELMLLGRRIHLQAEKRSRIYERRNHLVRELGKTLPFELTEAQKRVLRAIDSDLTGGSPLNRMLQGDVGSGKTIVAVFAALRAVENGYQAAFMAPTEVLAEQHFRSLGRLLAPVGVEVACLLGKMSQAERRPVLQKLKDGAARIAVGTHALIQEGVEFADLGLAIIDEQHRFGVNQRLLLKRKGVQTDCLVMTATPIPRSLALTLYGDLDVSVIDELPAGRKPIATHIVPERKRADMQRFMAERVQAGERVYVVCPRIEQDEESELAAAEQWFARYKEKIFPGLSVVLVHGKLPPAQKETAMRAFESGAAQVLVGTTVIEVGIDVPEATVVVIEGAERFGLSQLHQLRGRVGRSHRQSWCFLIPSPGAGGDSLTRLKILESTTDGFKISEEDLRLRGPGDFFGERQSGLPDLRLADLVADYPVLVEARQAAERILKADPWLQAPEHDILRHELILRYRSRTDFLRSG
ncbi:ATP-dependent DNA helicase RecG [bacterium]|nr:ATP-dependent DNA helicase RecG [bacterium]